VVWAKTEARGKSIPLDPEPHPDGNVVLVPVPQSRHAVARVLQATALPVDPGDGPAYLSHFVTCRAGRPARRRRTQHSCQLCPWVVSKSVRAEADRLWREHYQERHHDRCRSCDLPVTWIRAEEDMRIVMLEPEPSEAGDRILVRSAQHNQIVARRVERATVLDVGDLYELHPCEVVFGA